jgi:membrane fusion protein (multidrug efflux system)
MDEEKKPVNHRRRKTLSLVVFSTITVIGALTVFFYLQYKKTHIATDDAYVDGRIHIIAAKVPGTVQKIHVSDNQKVKRDDILIDIDAVDYDIRVKEAIAGYEAEKATLAEIDARIGAEKKRLSELQAGIEVAKANLVLQEATLRQAEIDRDRAKSLYSKEVISKERYEKAETYFDVTLAQVKAAYEKLKQSESALATQQALIRQFLSKKDTQMAVIQQKEVLVESAKINSGYTTVRAPSDGYITRKSVEVGNQIKVGQPLMAIVPLDDIWVVANYKETQLENVRPGQKVRIEVDSYPSEKFTGRVDSIMAGTGAVFSLFPPENATGNYVKVVQRIPVKIVIMKESDPQHVLRVGMSVIPTILVEK